MTMIYEVTTVLGFAVDIDEVDITTDIHSEYDIELKPSPEFHLSSDAVNLIEDSIEDAEILLRSNGRTR